MTPPDLTREQFEERLRAWVDDLLRRRRDRLRSFEGWKARVRVEKNDHGFRYSVAVECEGHPALKFEGTAPPWITWDRMQNAIDGSLCAAIDGLEATGAPKVEAVYHEPGSGVPPAGRPERGNT